MTESYDIIPDDRNDDEAAAVWDSPVAFAPQSNTRKLVRALLSEASRIDENLEAIYEQQHIDSATGGALESWGNLVGVSRQTAESDDKYRARIKAELRQGTIGPTFNEFSQFTGTLLNTDVSNIEFTLSGDPATVSVGIPSNVLNNNNLSDADVSTILNGAVPAGHEVSVFEIQQNPFTLIGDGDTNDPTRGLTGDNTSDGGTLVGDIG